MPYEQVERSKPGITAPPTLTAIIVPGQSITTGIAYRIPKNGTSSPDIKFRSGSCAIGMFRKLPASEASNKSRPTWG